MLFAWVDLVNADEVVVPNIVIPKGGTATLDIQLNNEQELNRTLQFYVKLPDGISVVTHSEVLGDRFSGTNVTVTGNLENDNRYVIYTINGFNESDNFPIPGNSGTIVTLDLTADESLEEGTVLNASIEDIEINLFFKDKEASPSDVPTTSTFQISIGQPDDGRIEFNETATSLPPYTAGTKGNVRMTRTIKANQWSTIVLPFTLDKTKAETIFGSDVQLAEFTGFETVYEDEDVPVPSSITINFSTYTLKGTKPMSGGKPFLIKTSKDITSFEADDCTLVGAVSDVTKPDKEYEISGKFTGTFVKTKVPADGLFISDEKFYYSTGATNIKAFRGWFELGAVLDKETDFGVKMFINGLETKVDGIGIKDATGTIYDLNGRKVAKPQQRGIYIVNGSKVVK